MTEFTRKERESRRDIRFPSFVTLLSSYYLGINVYKVIPDIREWTIEFLDDGQNGAPTNAQIESITNFGGIIDIISYAARLLRLRGPSEARIIHVDERDRLQQVVGRPLLVRVKCPKCDQGVQAKVVRTGKGSKLLCLRCNNSWC